MPSKERRKKDDKKKQRITKQATKTIAEFEKDKLANKNNQDKYRRNLNKEEQKLIKEKDARYHQARRNNLTTSEKAEIREQNTSRRANKRVCLLEAEKIKIREEDSKRTEKKHAMKTPEQRRKRLESHYNSKVNSRKNQTTNNKRSCLAIDTKNVTYIRLFPMITAIKPY
jgi:hypothetical protein